MPSKSEYIFYRKTYYSFLPAYKTILSRFDGKWSEAVKEAEEYLKNYN